MLNVLRVLTCVGFLPTAHSDQTEEDQSVFRMRQRKHQHRSKTRARRHHNQHSHPFPSNLQNKLRIPSKSARIHARIQHSRHLAVQNEFTNTSGSEESMSADVPWTATNILQQEQPLPRSTKRSTRPVRRVPPTRKIYAIGDLHGDDYSFMIILETAKLARFVRPANSTAKIHNIRDKEPIWTGGNSILVSIGDIVDRGDHSKFIFESFQKLARQAPSHGGEIINIIGNHELMNLQQDFRYVGPTERFDIGDYHGEANRKNMFGLTGSIGRDIRNRFYPVVVRDGILFSHAGIHPDVLYRFSTQTYHYGNMSLTENIPTIQRNMTLLESGISALQNFNQRFHTLINQDPVVLEATNAVDDSVIGMDGPFWTRFFEEQPENIVCEQLRKTLDMTGAHRMVVGHCPQMGKKIGVKCDGKLLLIDTVISSAYKPLLGFSQPSIVEFYDNAEGRQVFRAHYFFEENNNGRLRVVQSNKVQAAPVSLDIDLADLQKKDIFD